MKKIFLFLFFLVLLPGFISAGLYSSCEIYGNCEEGLEIEEGGNYTINVNNSLLWNGNSWSDTRWLNIDGSNANQDVDIGAYDFYADDGIFDGVSSRFNSTLLIDGDIANDNAYLVIDSKINMYSCINLTEGDLYGFSICNDGSGINRFVISDFNNGYEYFIIDRNTGLITLNNDTLINGNITADYFIGSGAHLTNLNVSGVMNVTGDFTGYAINISYLYGALGIGGMDMRGDPWYFSGADFQIAEDLLVDGNITASLFNGINISNLSNVYVPLAGGTMTGDLIIIGNITIIGNEGIRTGALDIDFVGTPDSFQGELVSGSELEIGDYRYSISYITDIGETNTKLIDGTEITTTLGNQKVKLTLPTTTDERVTHINIYRTEVGASAYWYGLVDTVTIGTTEYIDDTPDASLPTLSTDPYYQADSTSKGITFNNNVALNVGGFTYVGNSAGDEINVDNNAVLVGNKAGYYGESSFGLVAIGTEAGKNSEGNFGVMIGYQAGEYSDGIRNTIVGYNSGYLNDAQSVSFLGFESGASNIGRYLVAIGQSSGYHNTGANSLFIGYESGYMNQGGNSIGIGLGALKENTGDNTIGIGYEAGWYNNDSNQFIVQQRNINAVPLIQGDFLSGEINVTSLNIAGNLTIGQKITFAFGEIIDNIVDGWIRINGNLNVTEDLNVVGNFTGNQIYGEMYEHNHTGTTLTFADGVWNKLYFTNSGLVNGFTYTGGFMETSNLTAQVSGTYQAIYRLSGSGQNNHVYHSTILINSVAQDKCGDHKKMSAGGDVSPMGSSCFIELNVDDDVQVAVMDYGASGDGVYYSGNLNLIRVGGL